MITKGEGEGQKSQKNVDVFYERLLIRNMCPVHHPPASFYSKVNLLKNCTDWRHREMKNRIL